MRMHVKKAKKIAILGVMAALSTVLTVLGTVISVNTIFFTAAAAYLAGIAVILYGMGAGTLFYCVCAALDFVVNPDKLHVFLYLALAGYILVSEGSYRWMKGMPPGRKKEWLHRFLRLVIFAVLYSLVVIFLPRLFVSEEILERAWFLPVMLSAGVVVWFLYDLGYMEAKKWLHGRFSS